MFPKTLVLWSVTQNGIQIGDDNPNSKKATNTTMSNKLQIFQDCCFQDLIVSILLCIVHFVMKSSHFVIPVSVCNKNNMSHF